MPGRTRTNRTCGWSECRTRAGCRNSREFSAGDAASASAARQAPGTATRMGRDPAGCSGRRSRQGPGRRGARPERQARRHDPTKNHYGSPAVRHRSPPSGVCQFQLEIAHFFQIAPLTFRKIAPDRGTVFPCLSSRVTRRSLRAGGFAVGEGGATHRRDAAAGGRTARSPTQTAGPATGARPVPNRSSRFEAPVSDIGYTPCPGTLWPQARKGPCGPDRPHGCPGGLREPEWRTAAEAGRDDGLPSRRGGLRVLRTTAPLRGAEFFRNSPLDSAPHSFQRPGNLDR